MITSLSQARFFRERKALIKRPALINTVHLGSTYIGRRWCAIGDAALSRFSDTKLEIRIDLRGDLSRIRSRRLVGSTSPHWITVAKDSRCYRGERIGNDLILCDPLSG